MKVNQANLKLMKNLRGPLEIEVSGEGDLDTWNSGGIKTFVHSYKPLKYLNRNLRVKNNKNVKIALSIPLLSLFFGHQSKDWLLKG